MRIRSKFLALVFFVAGGFLAMAVLALKTYGDLSAMRGAIDGGVRLIAQSRRAHGLMKDVVFDLFSPRVYSSLQGITLAPRSMATRKEWSEAVAQFRSAYEGFMGDPALKGLLADEELRVAYNVAWPMGERAFKEIADLDAAFELIRERYPGEEELYIRLQLSKDESLYSVFGQ
ncbi:MAG: hypothetical protein Q8M76_04690, partial [Spirochaetaceae bacterium]|nr:hypothetical protein [Spirochaetaceae bacterium]